MSASLANRKKRHRRCTEEVSEDEDTGVESHHRKQLEQGLRIVNGLGDRTMTSKQGLSVSEPDVDLANQAAFDSVERIVAATLHCKGLHRLSRASLQAATCTITSFIHQLAMETKKQAETSFRSRANVFDVTRALAKSNACLASRLFRLSRHETLGLSEDCEEFMREVHSQIPLLRAYSSPSLNSTSVDQYLNHPPINSSEYWNDIGEPDVLHDGQNDVWERKRRRCRFVDVLDVNLLQTDVRDTAQTSTIDATQDPLGLRNWDNGSPNACHSYMPQLPMECLRLGRHKQSCLTEPPIDLHTRREQMLEDNLYVQLLLPTVLEDIPKIEQVDGKHKEFEDFADVDLTATTAGANLFISGDG